MKVLLTGATGFVGSHILDSLRARDIATAVLLRATSSKRFIAEHLPHIELRTGSVAEPQLLDAALRDVTHVIHCAGQTKALCAAEFYEVNQTGTRQVVQAVNQQQGRIQRLVYVSSMAAGGPATRDRPAREEDTPHPVSEYGKSKLGGEQEVRHACKAEYVILRPPAVYGPRDTAFLPLFKAIRAHLFPRFGHDPMAMSVVFARDLAEAVVACLTCAGASGKTFYVASPEITTSDGLGCEIASQMKTRTLTLPLPTAALWPLCCAQDLVSRWTRKPPMLSRHKYAELRALGWVCDPERLRKEVGFVCATTIKNGIAQTLAWYREQAWL